MAITVFAMAIMFLEMWFKIWVITICGLLSAI